MDPALSSSLFCPPRKPPRRDCRGAQITQREVPGGARQNLCATSEAFNGGVGMREWGQCMQRQEDQPV